MPFMVVPANPVVHAEIPVTNMDRALRFYSGVLGLEFERRKVDGYDMAFATRWAGATGASGFFIHIMAMNRSTALGFVRKAAISKGPAKRRLSLSTIQL